MKVLLITRGGIDSEKLIGNFELDQAIALKKCNIDVRVLSLDIRRKISYNESDSRYINYMGISIYCYKLGKVSRILPFSVKSSISQWKMLRCFKNITQNWRPDLVHAHFGDVAYQALKIKKANNNLPFVVTEHFSLMNSEKPNRLLLQRMVKTYKNANKLICVSNSFRDNLNKSTGFQFEVLPNLLDPMFFDKNISIKKKIEKKQPIRIISAGNYTKNKNFTFLISILSEITEIDWHLEIYGSGYEYKNMNDMVERLNLSHKITIGHRLERKNLIEKYLNSDIFILLSKKETFGVVYIEAMACGLPVVSLECGGTEDIINKTNGIIIREKDNEKVKNSIRKILSEVNDYNRQKIANDTYNAYNFRNIIDRQLRIYNDLL
ncbi:MULTISPECIES: glycosyltransferase [Clostridium]|uniref:glycosyltransferase n=1 Tax=Clostridium TaxID=1485 RepID=UPI0012BA35D3|nr:MULTISPECIES: glycosyltransferase [Clostridium]MBS6888905.1 glycosyltransferase [Clostridium sp.]MDU2108052.1 glycosyltransferase [Clostridium sp.]MDU3354594.1 glycosyltransferase [Clostridium sp.]